MDKSTVWNRFPELETKRLTLKKIESKHAKELITFWGDENVTKYTDFESFTSLSNIEDVIQWMGSKFSELSGIRWGIFLKKKSKLIGTCGFNSWIINKSNKGEIGYDLHPKYWNQGIMSESLKEILKYGFNEMKLHRIEAFIDPNNITSQKLLEKLKFTKEGCLRDNNYWKGKFQTVLIYSLLQNDYF